MIVKVTYRFAKQAKRSLRFESADETIAMGAVYLTKMALGFPDPDAEIPDDKLPREFEVTFERSL